MKIMMFRLCIAGLHQKIRSMGCVSLLVTAGALQLVDFNPLDHYKFPSKHCFQFSKILSPGL